MVDKSDAEIEAEIDKLEDDLTMNELQKIGDTMQDNIKTEADFPSKHPELGMKVPVLDLAICVEEVRVHSLDSDMSHLNCDEVIQCLPVGQKATHDHEEVFTHVESSHRMVLKVHLKIFIKPCAPQNVIHAESAQPREQKRTAMTQ